MGVSAGNLLYVTPKQLMVSFCSGSFSLWDFILFYFLSIWHTVLCNLLCLTATSQRFLDVIVGGYISIYFHYYIIFHCVDDIAQCLVYSPIEGPGSGVSLGHRLFRFSKAEFFYRGSKIKRKKEKVGGVDLVFLHFAKEGWDRIIKKKRQMKAGKCQGAERSQLCRQFLNQAQAALRKTVRD